MTNKLLKIGFPNKIFLTVEHDLKATGEFAFEFWYLDQSVNQKVEELLDSYALIVTKYKERAAEEEMIWVYVIGSAIISIIGMCIVYFYFRLRYLNRVKRVVDMEKNGKGANTKWGYAVPVPEDSIIESNKIKDHKEIIETLGGAELEVKYAPECQEKEQKQELKDNKL